MKIALIIGQWSSGNHGKLNPEELYVKRALTGSESSFFNLARALVTRGHQVTVYCDVEPNKSAMAFGFNVRSIFSELKQDCDVYVSLNEPDQLKHAPKDKLRICWEQMGDFPSHSNPEFDSWVDKYVALSPVHLNYIARPSSLSPKTPLDKWVWIPNSINKEFYATDQDVWRSRTKMVWCSSPDRGLHRLLEMFPEIRKRVPEATLDIYYRFDPWFETFKEFTGFFGDRARYIGKCLAQLGRDGENGVTVFGATPNMEIAKKLLGAGVLPYTCDVMQFTESFSVSVMDACAAGCVPIISDADALGDIYKNVAQVIPGKPGKYKPAWIETITKAMVDEAWAIDTASRASSFASVFHRDSVAALWEDLFKGKTEKLPGTIQDYVRQIDRSVAAELYISGAPGAVGSPGLSDGPGPQGPANAAVPPPQVTQSTADAAVTPPQIPPEPYKIEVSNRPLRIAVLMGKTGTPVHGYLDILNAFESETQFVTGTVAGFFNIAWGLAERGHQIDAFCDAHKNAVGCARFGGANFYAADAHSPDDTYDAYLSINEPDVLRGKPANKLRVVAMWLNDFSFCQPGWDAAVDLYACPSQTHLDYMANVNGIGRERLAIVPLSINPELHAQSLPRKKNSIAYCSSPDRGLHHLLNMFPEIRSRVPEATLRIYYRVQPWYEGIMALASQGRIDAEMEARARGVWEALDKQGRNGENGVQLVGPVPQKTMARELKQTQVLAYTCDPTRFTEGFSVTVMDACAAGCVPIISGVDALPEIYWNAAHIIPGNPGLHRQEWIDAIVLALTDEGFAAEIRTSAKAHVRNFTRQRVALQWEKLIRERMAVQK